MNLVDSEQALIEIAAKAMQVRSVAYWLCTEVAWSEWFKQEWIDDYQRGWMHQS